MGGQEDRYDNYKKTRDVLLRGIANAKVEVNKSYDTGTGHLLAQYEQSRTDLNTHLGAAIDAGNQWASLGLTAYQQMTQQQTDPNAALNTYLNSADYKLFYGGEGGAGGDPNKSALERFKESPDYQFRLNQSLNAVNRRASVGGYLNTPRLSQELISQAGQTASQEWGAYSDRLSNNYQSYANRLGQSAQIGFQAMQGNQQMQGQLGTGLASMSQAYGQNMSDWGRWRGEQLANAELAIGNVNAQYYLTKEGGSAQGWMGKV